MVARPVAEAFSGSANGLLSASDRNRRTVRAALLCLAVLVGALVLPAAAAAGGSQLTLHRGGAGEEASEAARWGYLIGLGVVLAILLIGVAVRARVAMLFVGTDGRVSTSKTIAAVWTIVVAAVFFGAVYANILNHPQPLNAMGGSGIVGQYALLFGGPLGAAIVAKGIVSGQVAKHPKASGSANLTDLITNDAGETDLGDFQYVLFNLVALVFVISTLVHTPLSGLPHVPDVLLGLTSVSAVGYVGKKAVVPGGTLVAQLEPDRGGTNDELVLTVSGLPPTTTTLSEWVGFGNQQAGQFVLADVAVKNGLASAPLTPPPINAPAQTTVDVTVVTGDGSVLKANPFTYT